MARREDKPTPSGTEGRSYYLILSIDGDPYGYPLEGIRQILLRSDVEVIPWEGDETFVGAIKHKDAMVPVIELRGILGLPASKVRFSRQGIVLVEGACGPCGLLVDECKGVRSYPPAAFSRFEPTLASGDGPVFSGLFHDGKEIIVFFADRALLGGRLQEKIRAHLKNANAFFEIACKVKALEAEIEEKPTVDRFLQLAELYQKQGRKKDSERCLLMAESMERSAEATCEGRTPVLRGDIESGIFVEILQMLSLSGKSGDLCVRAPGQSDESVLHFRQGQIWDARAGWKVGRDAVRDILVMNEGQWEFHTERVEPIERRITKNAQFLILDALKVKDESGLAREAGSIDFLAEPSKA